MNTRIWYLYRDADNYKVQNACVVEGSFTREQIETILACCEAGEFFIPSQVGLPEMRFDDYDPDSDHCWFEITGEGFEPTEDPPTTDVTSGQLVERFSLCRSRWEDSAFGMNGWEASTTGMSGMGTMEWKQ